MFIIKPAQIYFMDLIVDDVGSFPLPPYTSADYFTKFYWMTYQAVVKHADIWQNRGLRINVIHPIQEIFRIKLQTGLDVVNYPQLMDMYTQFLKPMKEFQEGGEPHLISSDAAIMVEMKILERWAKQYYEETGNTANLKICITGPLELYLKQYGFSIYADMVLNFAKSINRMLQNSILNSNYIKTKVISIDEPSLGYVTLSGIENDDIIRVYDAALEGFQIDTQIHLHSLNAFKIPLRTKNIRILTCEFASNPNNIIDKRYLEEHDKFMRVGITRTNFNAIMADVLDQGGEYGHLNTTSGLKSLIDPPERIRNILEKAIKQYGDRLKYVGPDCGLSAWSPPDLAAELLKRTVNVVREYEKNPIH
jgi:5-methyltetrahydropteroyltriglutamate--homocysteine methyltransferase